MKITVLTGSPHKNGTSAYMAASFISGVKDAGHEVYRFDAAFKNVHPCIGCDKCECGKNSCVFQDDMQEAYHHIMEADMIVFVTPLYYHNVCAQLKTVVDRFHGIDDLIRGTGKKAALIVTAADSRDWIFDGIKVAYTTTLRYLGWEDAGQVLANGSYRLEDLKGTDFVAQAYEFGKNL